ncbi:MAG TPA: hypothetical protein P5522_10830 [Spirochaetia bacterium]|nr:hypothetical protein [Spirochaetia bacterium]
MAGFKFQSTKLNFPIVDENDNVIKGYSVDVGNESFLRGVMKKGREVVAEIDSAENDIDRSKNQIKDFVDTVLGVGEFEFLYERFGQNLFAMVELVHALSREIEGVWKKRTSIYD